MAESDYDEDTTTLQNWNDVFENSEFPYGRIEEQDREPFNVSVKKSETSVNFNTNRSRPKINLETLNEKHDLALKQISHMEEKIDHMSSELTMLTALFTSKLSSVVNMHKSINMSSDENRDSSEIKSSPSTEKGSIEIIQSIDSQSESEPERDAEKQTNPNLAELEQEVDNDLGEDKLDDVVEISEGDLGEDKPDDVVEISEGDLGEDKLDDVVEISEGDLGEDKPDNNTGIALNDQEPVPGELNGKVEEIPDNIESNSSIVPPEEVESLVDCSKEMIFKPFYNKENYACTDNYTTLIGNYIKMEVVILGDSDKMHIYPFGKYMIDDIERNFQERSYPAKISYDYDNPPEEIGTVYLNFYPDETMRKYIFTPASDYETPDEEKVSFSTLIMPFTIKLECKLE